MAYRLPRGRVEQTGLPPARISSSEPAAVRWRRIPGGQVVVWSWPIRVRQPSASHRCSARTRRRRRAAHDATLAAVRAWAAVGSSPKDVRSGTRCERIALECANQHSPAAGCAQFGTGPIDHDSLDAHRLQHRHGARELRQVVIATPTTPPAPRSAVSAAGSSRSWTPLIARTAPAATASRRRQRRASARGELRDAEQDDVCCSCRRPGTECAPWESPQSKRSGACPAIGGIDDSRRRTHRRPDWASESNAPPGRRLLSCT